MDGTTKPAGTSGTTNRAAAAVNEAAELITMIRTLARRTGLDIQARQAVALGISDTSLSAYLHGRIPPEKTLMKMLDRAGVPAGEHPRHLAVLQRASRVSHRASAAEPGADRMVDAPETPADTADTTDPPISTRQRRGVPAGIRRRVGLAAAVIAAVIAAASVLASTAAYLSIGPSAAPGTDPPTTESFKLCDRYSIDAETLGLRTPDGALTGEDLTRGTEVTVLRRGGPAGRSYWYVTSSDRRQAGWVLPYAHWWHSTC
jgi:hypothetical protein